MVARKVSILPPGFLSLEDAMDRIDPGVFQDKGSNKECQEFDRYVEYNIASIRETKTVPEPILVEALRRKRRRTAFQDLVALCAYGTVGSALLLDDFTIRAGIPAKFWLNERLSKDMFSTGRTMVQEPWRELSVSGPSGWVIVDADALDAALVAELTKKTIGDDLQQRVRMLRANDEGCALIHEAIAAIFSLAKTQDVKPPNVKEVIKPVQAWLQTYRHSTAPGNLIGKLAGDGRYSGYRGKVGETVAGRLYPVSNLKI